MVEDQAATPEQEPLAGVVVVDLVVVVATLVVEVGGGGGGGDPDTGQDCARTEVIQAESACGYYS